MILLVDSHHGIYCPQIAVERLLEMGLIEGSEDTDTVLQGPDHEWYWDSWDFILSHNERLVHNEDVWLLDEGEDWPGEWE